MYGSLISVSFVNDIILDWVLLKSISSGLDLFDSAEAKQLHVWCPKELLVVARINQLLLNRSDWTLYIADKFSSISALKLPDLCFVIEYWVFKYLLNVFVAYFRRLFPWWSEMLSTINSKIDLGVSKIFRFIIR